MAYKRTRTSKVRKGTRVSGSFRQPYGPRGRFRIGTGKSGKWSRSTSGYRKKRRYRGKGRTRRFKKGGHRRR